ncbi:ABC1 kinase family protein [Neobacillus sp. SM06]|uniref:ABC1 kinase family protein n=1 Tax=Neobacillus sp. SM06 TaxID=3422492 RepID=UPI003D29F5E0
MRKVHFYSKRYREIVKILIKHGFGFLLVKLGLDRLFPFHQGSFGHRVQEAPYTEPQHLRAAFEELGTTFIKMGQILSTRSDLLPQSYIEDLSKLQASVPPLEFDEIRECIKEELGENWRSLFSRFDETPLASASIGQVYRAVLTNGEQVIVKVQRPEIEDTVIEDLQIIQHLAQLAQNRLRLGEIVNFTDLVQEFGAALMKELDYVQEGKNIERFDSNFHGNQKLCIPKVYWDLTTKRIITMEEVKGYSVDELVSIKETTIDVKKLARNCAEILLKMIFEDGFFHGDLHPGNLFIKRDGSLALIDFGLVGELTEESRSQMVSLFLGLAQKNESKIADVLLSLDPENQHAHVDLLKKDLKIFIDRYLHDTLAEIDLAKAVGKLLEIIYKNKIRVPGHFSLLAKTIVMSEGIGRRLDPEFNLFEFMANNAPRLYFQNFRTEQKKKVKQAALDLFALSTEAPGLVLNILRKAKQDQLEVQMNVKKPESLISELNKMFNRLALSILTSAIIISLALVMLIYHPGSTGTVNNLSWLFTGGFVISILFGGSVLFSIWRSNKRK